LLIANRQRPAADLETEATRILAIQRTRPVTPAPDQQGEGHPD
jgi:hypothetical protein